MALYYCKKCGRVVLRVKNLDGSFNDKCDYCGSTVCPVPEKYWYEGHDCAITNEQKELLREELVKTAPEFDEYFFEHREEFLRRQQSEFDAAFKRVEAFREGRDKGNKFGIECPYCHATNVKKISGFSKAVELGVFGIFAADRIGKQWHCNHCGSDF